MRYGILGDIHSNIEALDAVLAALAERDVGCHISVGDIVGYGADPAACIARVREIGAIVVAGNHDWACIGKLDSSFFNVYAKQAVEWTAATLTPSEKKWLADLPLAEIVDGEITVVHATLDDPEQFDYIQSFYDAARSINAMQTPVCVNGHSHIPMAFLMEDTLRLSHDHRIDLNGTSRALINVGSIGQPRDENPKAAYAIYDSATRIYELHRVTYDIAAASHKIKAAGLPDILGERLKFGR